MKTAIDYTKAIAQIAEQYKAEVTHEGGVYQIDGLAGHGGEISDKIRAALPDVSLDIKVCKDGMVEVEITEG